jgi:hypothetical protein
MAIRHLLAIEGCKFFESSGALGVCVEYGMKGQRDRD